MRNIRDGAGAAHTECRVQRAAAACRCESCHVGDTETCPHHESRSSSIYSGTQREFQGPKDLCLWLGAVDVFIKAYETS